MKSFTNRELVTIICALEWFDGRSKRIPSGFEKRFEHFPPLDSDANRALVRVFQEELHARQTVADQPATSGR